MAILRMSEIRKYRPEQRETRLLQYRKELMDVYSQLSAGGSIEDPSKIKQLKKTIARLLTVGNEKDSS
ncbi:MAG: 50S ribosomal protein L29P [Candidatus Heimdallarchaeota archaeon LC_2]|uniref:Putative 50S ribosomal protein L29P n=1 Tax=uncultured organism TaxID=155900 RepID=A0A0F6PZX3_9ZZZZ|nr:putative 50S ribosomal protein L29P [uncultured organism]OLS28550.1 MAG: 50S ribosomal protein L29P [Candidatus Heimdallarchaeota archaeon LC_2]